MATPPTSLKQQILIACLLPTILATCLLSLYLYSAHSLSLRNQLIDTGKILTRQLAHQSLPMLQQNDIPALDQLARAALDAPQVRSVSVLDREQHIITQLGPASFSADKLALANSTQETRVIHAGDNWLITSPIANNELHGWLVIEFSTLYLQVQNFQQLFLSLIIIAVVLLAAVWLAHRYFNGHIESWQLLVSSVQRLTKGQPLPEPGNAKNNDFAIMENAIRQLSAALQIQQQEYEQHIEQSMHDLRETLETIEIQNIELDLARREAVQASKMKSEFLANTSHEIRTPLNGIAGFTRLLARTSLSAQQRDYLDTIRQSSESLLTLINDILDLSKMEAGKFSLDHTVFNLAELTEQTLAILAPGAQEKGLELLQITDANVPTQFNGDSQRIRQVLTNLISNAVKFTERGSVTLHISRKTDSSRSPVIKFSVVDTGIGLPHDRQHDIFQAFTQLDAGSNRQYGGSGLGLTICKKLVEQMGGDIGLDSEEHKGSTFWFTLKLDATPASDTGEEWLTELPPCTLLVFDAHFASRLALTQVLDKLGINVRIAERLSDIPVLLDGVQKPDADGVLISIAAHTNDVMRAELLDMIIQLSATQSRPVLVYTPANHKQWPEMPANIYPISKLASARRVALAISAAMSHTPVVASASSTAPTTQPRWDKTPQALVVDDNNTNLRLLTALLSDLGLEVLNASSGSEAIVQCQRHHPDIIFMDIQMPGMDGLEATRCIRQLHEKLSTVPVVAVTAHAQPEQKQLFLQEGMNAYLSKPIHDSQLVAVLRQFLGLPLAQTFSSVGALDTTSSTATHHNCVDRDLAIRLCFNKPELARDMLTGLLRDLPQDSTTIRTLLASQEWGAAQEHVHRLHGACSYCGVPELKQACANFETAFKTQQLDEHTITALLTALDNLLAWQQEHVIDDLF